MAPCKASTLSRLPCNPGWDIWLTVDQPEPEWAITSKQAEPGQQGASNPRP